jgi:hypothetical protein
VLIGSGVWWAVLIPTFRALIRLGKPEWTSVVIRAVGALFVMGGLVVGIGTVIGLLGSSR